MIFLIFFLDFLSYRMFRYLYFFRIRKELFLCSLELGVFNLGVWLKKIYVIVERYGYFEV